MQCTARPSARVRAASRRPAADSGSYVGRAASLPLTTTPPLSDTRAPLDDRLIPAPGETDGGLGEERGGR